MFGFCVCVFCVFVFFFFFFFCVFVAGVSWVELGEIMMRKKYIYVIIKIWYQKYKTLPLPLSKPKQHEILKCYEIKMKTIHCSYLLANATRELLSFTSVH